MTRCISLHEVRGGVASNPTRCGRTAVLKTVSTVTAPNSSGKKSMTSVGYERVSGPHLAPGYTSSAVRQPFTAALGQGVARNPAVPRRR